MTPAQREIKQHKEDIAAYIEDIQALRNGANLKKMGVPAGVSCEDAITGWTNAMDKLQARVARLEGVTV